MSISKCSVGLIRMIFIVYLEHMVAVVLATVLLAELVDGWCCPKNISYSPQQEGRDILVTEHLMQLCSTLQYSLLIVLVFPSE